ncbi:DUF488 domain-containing protein [Natronobacterium texcoconense]|uniref:DUF488 domain-containing protein n=1 Tax=Natronobacterium texcoconense TaxID=1095778 RepID=A0A1H1FZL6_NATTX|nr:DUF488 domain-containing protein [Natronobacterium texcoconense]SDR06360.1 Protein of unknown function, DUF488 [Natronobacterium texcoconense]
MSGTIDSSTTIYTIGFTKKDARTFFGLLEDANIQRLFDVRLNNRSQLAGFAKRDDLKYFLDSLLEIDYDHRESLAPTKELLDAWRDDTISWTEYERRFEQLLRDREIEKTLDPALFEEPTVLLCSEHKPEYCHRRLIVEYLNDHWGNVEGVHLTG